MPTLRRRQKSLKPKTVERLLLNRRQDLLNKLELKLNSIAEFGHVNEDDQAQISHDEFISIHLNSLDYEQFRLVQQALDRLKAGDYGTCRGCGRPISEKRLLIVPWAQYCVPCQELLSSMHRLDGNSFPGELGDEENWH